MKKGGRWCRKFITEEHVTNNFLTKIVFEFSIAKSFLTVSLITTVRTILI